MRNSIKLSIIVPVYNVEKYLKRCILSIINQDISKDCYEIILINDGSTDSSGEIARSLTSQNDNIRLIEQENRGLSGARNTGLDMARGAYVMFVDSDDTLLPNVVSKILNTAENNNLDVCAYRIIYFDAEGNKHNGSIQPFDPHKIYDGRYALTHGADIGAVWINLYSREMLEKYQLRFLDKIYHQDVDFNLRMYAYVDRIMFTDIIGYCYCYNDTAISRITSSEKAFKHLSDNLIIVRHIRDFAEQNYHGKKIKSFYRKHGNSLLVSNMIAVRKSELLTRNDKLRFFEKMKDLNLYPIIGRTLSWKSSLLVPFLNCRWLYKQMLKWA